MPDTEGQSYEVGYGKPPAGTRFTKGRSGNPKGRPKGSRNITTIFEQVLQERVRVTENGKARAMPKIEAIGRQLTSKAMGGDMKAINAVVALKQIIDAAPDLTAPDSPDSEKNQAVVKLFAERLMKMNSENATPPEPQNGDEPQ